MRPLIRLLILLLFGSVLHLSCEKQGQASMDAASMSGAGGSLARFAVVGNYLYSVDSHMLDIYDLSDPKKPTRKTPVYAGFDIETIFAYKDKLYLGASNGMYVYSIADPVQPVKLSSITHFRACDPVVSNDTASYVTLRNFGSTCGSTKNVLNVYNVKDPQQPKLVREVEMHSPYGLGISGKVLYVCEGNNGMVVFGLDDPYNPARIKEIKDETFYDVIPYGDVLIAYINKGICLFDIADAVNPVLLSKLKD